MHGSVEGYFDTAAVVTVLVLLGQVLELRARDQTSSAIRQLLRLAPTMARVVRDGREVDVPLADVRVGDLCRERPGEKVPVDGVVVSGATAGVLVRKAEALERLAQVDTLVIDKTGTLTEGKPALAVVRVFEGVSDDDVLRMASSLEQSSEHPLAAAIVSAARQRGLELDTVTSFRALPGKGIDSDLDGVRLSLGNAAMMADGGTSLDRMIVDAEAMHQEGQAVVYLAKAGRVIALFGVADPVKAMWLPWPETASTTRRRWPRRLSHATMRNIRQNLFLAFVYNAVGVPVAAGILYPSTGRLISPIWASAATTLSSVSVITNALRLGRLRL